MKKKKAGRIIDPDGWENPVRVVRKDGTPLADTAITLDMTYIPARSGSDVICSWREHNLFSSVCSPKHPSIISASMC